MAFQPLSIGDILMLSQQAWKIGRAFTQGKKSAPAEFAEVEREANGLSEALKLVAETLHTDGSVLSHAEVGTKAAVNTILESAHRTLDDLESFVERYQVIKKKQTNGGFVVERSWSEVVVANYKTFKWTTEGGDITELRNMLQTHTNTINLTMQALQSRSLARLEKTVVPMADNIASIHNRVNGDLGAKIDDLHRIIMGIANGTPSLVARDRAIEAPPNARGTASPHLLTESPRRFSKIGELEAPPQQSTSYSHLPIRTSQRDRYGHDLSVGYASAGAVQDARIGRGDSAHYSMIDKDSRRMDRSFESGSPPDPYASIGASYEPSGSSGANSYSTTPPRAVRESNVPRRESTTLPQLFSAIEEQHDDEGESSYDARVRTFRPPIQNPPYPQLREQVMLPPPAITPDPPEGRQSAATPSTMFGAPRGQDSSASVASHGSDQKIVRPATAKSSKAGKPGSPQSPNGNETPTFQKALFRNAAILCDVRGKLVEYARYVPDEPDPRYNTEMKTVCKESRVCVIRKRENLDHGGTRVVTSIWVLTDDGSVRLQQKLSDVNETVPYCSYFEPEKVSLPQTEEEISLRLHAENWGDQLTDEKKTSWVNYVLESENDAVAFQSAVFGRTLLGSYRTLKTTVVHEGLKGAFTMEEQFANIEMLRLWEDDGISTPGAAGGVLALMHISSNFGDGWARWWINSSKQQVRLKEDGTKYAKVKGIDMTVVKPGTGASTADKIRSPSTAGEGIQRVDTIAEPRPGPQGRKIRVKRVTGLRIEFKTEEEMGKFVSTGKRCQERMIPLPDL